MTFTFGSMLHSSIVILLVGDSKNRPGCSQPHALWAFALDNTSVGHTRLALWLSRLQMRLKWPSLYQTTIFGGVMELSKVFSIFSFFCLFRYKMMTQVLWTTGPECGVDTGPQNFLYTQLTTSNKSSSKFHFMSLCSSSGTPWQQDTFPAMYSPLVARLLWTTNHFVSHGHQCIAGVPLTGDSKLKGTARQTWWSMENAVLKNARTTTEFMLSGLSD